MRLVIVLLLALTTSLKAQYDPARDTIEFSDEVHTVARITPGEIEFVYNDTLLLVFKGISVKGNVYAGDAQVVSFYNYKPLEIAYVVVIDAYGNIATQVVIPELKFITTLGPEGLIGLYDSWADETFIETREYMYQRQIQRN